MRRKERKGRRLRTDPEGKENESGEKVDKQEKMGFRDEH